MSDDRWELIGLLDVFMTALDRPPTSPTDPEIRAFVDQLTEDQLRRYFASMLFDATRGLRPPQLKGWVA